MAMEISGHLDGLMGQAQAKAAGSELRKLSGEATRKSDLAGLEKAAKQFEAVFLNTMMKAMRRTVPEDKLFNSAGPMKFYQQMQDAEMAKAMATGHSQIGITEMIVRQFKNNVAGGESAAQAAKHPPVNPLGPEHRRGYGQQVPGQGDVTRMVRLRAQAARQGTAVADTLQRFDSEISLSARETGVHPALILSVMMEESGGDPLAESSRGAKGLMQLMPETARELGVRDATSPRQNVAGGSRYLSRLLARYQGDLDLALAAYNAGPGNVDRAGGKIPDFPETRNYVRKVRARYRELGGTDLANQARQPSLKSRSGELP